MYGTRYSVFGENNEILFDGSAKGKSPACFAKYNMTNAIPFTGKNSIIVYINKFFDPTIYGESRVGSAEMLFSLEQIKFHLDNLQSIFPTSFSEEEDQYLVSLKESDYISKTHIRAALDFIRLLWEMNINQTLVSYFSITNKKDLAKHEYFVVLQAIFSYLKIIGRIGYGHNLPCVSYLHSNVISSSELLNALNEYALLNPSLSSMSLWSSIADKKKKKYEDKQCSEPIHNPDVIKIFKSLNLDFSSKEPIISDLLKYFTYEK